MGTTIIEGMSAWLAALLQTVDSSFPTGAYAHSGGLETLAALGVVKDPHTLSVFLRERVVPMLGDYELPYLGFARAAAEAGNLAALLALDRELGAGKLPREAREASAQVGARRLQTPHGLGRTRRRGRLRRPGHAARPPGPRRGSAAGRRIGSTCRSRRP